uniref:Interleukin n=1 Tax=Oncorhynchus mykiss TaxID=8022 RepID=A0A0U5AVH5_ONCMY|nr:Interleukin-15 like [Oncorhynchus mykiss]
MLRRQRTDTLLPLLLWFLFFIAMTMKQAYGKSMCSKELPGIVRKCIEEVHKMESFDCRLYTPTLADYQQKCPTSTLICFEKEVNVLVLESGNKSSPIYKPKLSIRLKSLIKQKEGANCPDCEAHRERAAKDFLTTLQTILEWMNDQGCRKPSSH